MAPRQEDGDVSAGRLGLGKDYPAAARPRAPIARSLMSFLCILLKDIVALVGLLLGVQSSL